MPKTIYTEQDIDEMKARGVPCVDVTENVILTDLALERAHKHGLKINRTGQASPQATYSPSVNIYAAYPHPTPLAPDVFQKVKAGVLARLQGPVENDLLDATIRRVLNRL